MQEDNQATRNRVGFCPWCGAEISASAIDLRLKEIIWDRCQLTRPCSGALYTLVTDFQGFVFYPYKMRGHYVFTRPNLGRKAG